MQRPTQVLSVSWHCFMHRVSAGALPAAAPPSSEPTQLLMQELILSVQRSTQRLAPLGSDFILSPARPLEAKRRPTAATTPAAEATRGNFREKLMGDFSIGE